MMNRLRTALVSVTAVAVAMMVLGSNARAKSVSTASPQKYVRLLLRLAQGEIRNGTSLMKRYSSLKSTLNRLETMSKAAATNSRLVRKIDAEIAAVSKQESTVGASIQKNANALQATTVSLQAVLPADLPPQVQAQVSNVVQSGQTLVGAERGAATPVR